ncbi:ubiquinone/menaquinone biosynthesis C-methylase UbiE [Thiogranum longum]|uniref:Ubiquinone/menaquinone biosynthesis C-methylase UbiE n=1 Tax=Thiogranum longum TaxID=1537524 RepID=A0A4R1HCG0_9GAMM|nr:methyltransferase domain-containing protein [Thiogranum longum]TCK17935.1 ubiquinone/menaquinone biosynthesis C-methylase UbiE [Thiogranum longum]
MVNINSAFTGNIPENYDRYLGPMFFHCCAEDLAGRVSGYPAQKVLEIAAGTGIATRLLRDFLPDEVQLVASDLNPDMLRHAEQKFSAAENISFQPADAMQLPFGKAQFDVVVCQFGIMFCPDKIQAFSEAHRVLTPGGRLQFSVWGSLAHNPLPRTTNEILANYFDGDAPAFLHVPFSYYDPVEIQQDMEDAGFDDIEFTTLDGECVFSRPRHAALGIVTGSPLRIEIEQRGDTAVDDVVDGVASGLGKTFGERDCRVPMRWMVISASRVE